MRKFFSSIPIPIYFLLIAILAFGIYIPWFGFYGDDWSYIWYQHLLGFGGSGDFAAYDRPFSAMYYNITLFLLGEHIWPYQVLELLLRWGSAVLLWQILKLVWQQHLRPIFWTVALFLIYPGFGQQPVSVEFILHFAVLDLFLLSVWGMLKAIGADRKHYIWITGLSMICSASVFGLEYFVGLEILRPIFLWMIFKKENIPLMGRIKKIGLAWLPYLCVLGLFFYWRVFVFKFPTYQPGLLHDILVNPPGTLIGLARRIGMDFKILLIDAWRLIFHPPAGNLLMIYISILLGGIGLSLFFFNRFVNFENSMQGERPGEIWKAWPIQAIVIGVLSMIAAGLPFWVTGIPLSTAFPWDRTSLPFMLGVSLITTAAIELTIHPRFASIAMAGMVGLTLGWHLTNAEVYRQEWEHMKSFYWQLSWRAPGLKPGTIIMSDQIPLYKVSDSGMTAPLNWTYAPNYHDRNLPYEVFDLDVRLDSGFTGLTKLEKGQPVSHDYRSLFFSSTTDHLLVFSDQRNTCLHVLSPEDGIVDGLPVKVTRTLPLSNLAVIIPEPPIPAQPPAIVFGNEPDHGWCYIYQKADLARQQGDWQQVAALWKQASEKSLRPMTEFELFPFIEGLAMTGNFNQAGQLSQQVSQDVSLQKRLCLSWIAISKAPGMANKKESILSLIRDLNCGPF